MRAAARTGKGWGAPAVKLQMIGDRVVLPDGEVVGRTQLGYLRALLPIEDHPASKRVTPPEPEA